MAEYSISQLENFEKCPRQYKFIYVDGIKRHEEGIEAWQTQDDYRLMGRRFIEDYYRRHHPFDQGRVLGLEPHVRFPLDDAGRYKCKGIIDRLMRLVRAPGPVPVQEALGQGRGDAERGRRR